MKNFILQLAILLLPAYSFAQNNSVSKIYKNTLPKINISKDVNLHFRSPEPVQFVDLSTNKLIGDLPAENVVRIKIQQIEEEKHFVNDSLRKTLEIPIIFNENQELGVVTIVGQSFMAQYQLIYSENEQNGNIISNIEILPQDMQALEFPDFNMSNVELRKYAMELISKKEDRKIRTNKDLGLVS
ncbi:MAG TPA: conjugative transposon protein TraN, partial [Chryseobacterium sp.]|nr:conjugative transposon protein TraN [Chryseobacterium sp.]